MTDKEFRHLSRPELIDIIYELQKTEKQLREENAALTEKLQSKELKVSEAGSIAEASLSLNGVFEAAQAAADQYLSEIKNANADTERRCTAILTEAKNRAAQILQKAEDEAQSKQTAAEQLLQKAEQEAQSKMSAAEQEAQSKVTAAEQEAQSKKTAADQEIQKRWENFQQQAAALMNAHTELKALLER